MRPALTVFLYGLILAMKPSIVKLEVTILSNNTFGDVNADVGGQFKWVVTVKCTNNCPISWYHDDQHIRSEDGPISEKYNTTSDIHHPYKGKPKSERYTNKTVQLTINDINFSDAGTYRMRDTFFHDDLPIKLKLIVNDAPKVHLSETVDTLNEQESQINCSVTGYPLPRVKWYRPGNSDSSKHNIVYQEIPASDYNTTNDTPYHLTSTLRYRREVTTTIFCRATNVLGTQEKFRHFPIPMFLVFVV